MGRGTQFSLPPPKPGSSNALKNSKNADLILREDQKEWQRGIKSAEIMKGKQERAAAKAIREGWLAYYRVRAEESEREQEETEVAYSNAQLDCLDTSISCRCHLDEILAATTMPPSSQWSARGCHGP